MAGVHTTYRTTKGIGSNYVGMEGKLKLPSAYGARPNDANYKNGAFPEFMYGFYPTSISNKGCDCGIVCYPGGFKLFIADNGNGTFTESWKESPNYLSIAKGADVTLRVILTYRKLNIECLVDSVVKGTIFCSFVNDNIYNAFMNGCFVNTEMVIAINEDKDRNVNLVPAAYFKKGKFYNTNLINTAGKSVALTTSNSTEKYWEDSGFPEFNNYADSRPTGIGVMASGFVSDEASATTDKTTAPIV